MRKYMLMGLCFALLVNVSVSRADGQQEQKGGRSFDSLGGIDQLEKDIAGALSEMDTALENDKRETTPEDEYYLGRAVAASILQSYKVYDKEPALTQYVDSILQTLAINSPQPVMFNGYSVSILDSREINAFASPGGHVFVTRELVKCAPSEEALAAVLAHELAHIQLHHALSLIENVQSTLDLTATARRASEIAMRQATAREREILFKTDVTDMVNTMVINGYAQQQEFDADALAVVLLKRAGYDPKGMTEVLEILVKVQGNYPGGFNSTHPAPSARLASVTPVVRSNPAPDTRKYRLPRFKEILKK